MPQLMILTDTHDTTVDLLIREMGLPDEQLFRLNYDLLSRYSLTVTPNGFEIRDPLGRFATDQTVTKFLYRKPKRPLQFETELERFSEAENWMAIRAIINQLWATGRIVLVEPYDAAFRLDKITQLRLASKFFRIPETSFTFNRSVASKDSTQASKSLSGASVGEQLLHSASATAEMLDPQFPRLTQEQIDARFCVTVVYIHGRQFSFKSDRKPILERKMVDWNEEPGTHDLGNWTEIELGYDSVLEYLVCWLMKKFDLKYGQLDFLYDSRGLVFLGVNPNGQFASLDIENRTGMINAFCEEINPNTDLAPIRYPFDNEGFFDALEFDLWGLRPFKL
jgi:hypothetical protein